jgi:hypothetical protein
MLRSFRRSVTTFLGLVTLVYAQGAAQPVKLTNEQDRQLLMDQLKITTFPSGPGAYLASTYDESKANPYPKLPDPLVMNNGTKVTTPAQWKARRAEILELFDREVTDVDPRHSPRSPGRCSTPSMKRSAACRWSRSSSSDTSTTRRFRQSASTCRRR